MNRDSLGCTAAAGLAVLLAALAAPRSAQADIRTLRGSQLVLTDSMSQDTIIETDPALAGHIRVSMDGNLACLTLTDATTTAVVTASDCGDDDGTLHIDVPRGTAITITNSGAGDIRLGDTEGALTASLNGSGDLRGGNVGRLFLGVHGSANVTLGAARDGATVEMTGDGDVRLAGVSGALVLTHHGNGDFAAGHIDGPSADIDSSGSGDLLIGEGSVGRLSAQLHGDGGLGVAATVRDARVTASGGGDVKLGRVTGTLNRDASGGSDIYVGGPDLVDTIIGKVAKAITVGDRQTVIVHNANTESGHFFTVVAVGIMAFILWRIVRRRGVPPALGRARRPASGQPASPAVAAVCDTLARVEARLGMVEQYVTSREFELQQKFRKL